MEQHIGTSGYSYDYWGPHPNNPEVKNFYPIKTKTKWLKYYSGYLKSVEINCTRYRKLTPSMCQKWVSQVPENFSITIKASTYITHNKKLCDFDEWWKEFYPCILVLGSRFCTVLFQFPPVFVKSERNIAKLQTMKSIIPSHILCAFEFRDVSWYQSDSVMETLFTGGWTQVILTVPELRQALKFNFGNLPGGTHIGIINPDFVYLRFHGTTNYSSGTYGSARMIQAQELVNNINPKIVCAYFNNVDTWTLRPFNNMEMDYTDGIPVGPQLVPSAIYDAKLLSILLQ